MKEQGGGWQAVITPQARTAHDRWLAHRRGEGRLVLEGADLRHLGPPPTGALIGTRLVRCDFTGCALSDASFSHAELVGCVFRQAKLVEAYFGDAALIDCCFDGADATAGHLADVRVERGSWRDATMARANLGKSVWLDVDLARADLQQAQARRAYFKDCSLVGARLTAADISRSDFIHVDWRNAHVDAMVITLAGFERCGFHAIAGRPVAHKACTIREPDFSEAFDGSQVGSAARLYGLWGLPPPASPADIAGG